MTKGINRELVFKTRFRELIRQNMSLADEISSMKINLLQALGWESMPQVSFLTALQEVRRNREQLTKALSDLSYARKLIQRATQHEENNSHPPTE